MFRRDSNPKSDRTRQFDIGGSDLGAAMQRREATPTVGIRVGRTASRAGSGADVAF